MVNRRKIHLVMNILFSISLFYFFIWNFGLL